MTNWGTWRDPAAVVLAGAAAVFAWAVPGCATTPGQPAAKEGPAVPGQDVSLRAGDWEHTVQVVHRAARSRTGSVFAAEVEQAADEAVRGVLGEEYPFDAWARLVGEAGRVEVIAHPEAGPLSAAVAARLELVLSGTVDVIETGRGERGAPAPSGAGALGVARVLVWKPAWQNGAPVPALPDGFGAGAGDAAALLVDLVEPRVGGNPWKADVVVAAPSRAEAGVVVRYMLGARASGEIPDVQALAAGEGLTPPAVSWQRVAIPN